MISVVQSNSCSVMWCSCSGSCSCSCRRKFRSQTSDNMDKCEAEVGRVREEKRREETRGEERRGEEKRREEKKKDDQKRESLRRKRIHVREKVGKSRNTVFSNDLWLRRVEK